jgi:hypothetical protein
LDGYRSESFIFEYDVVVGLTDHETEQMVRVLDGISYTIPSGFYKNRNIRV